MLKRPKVNTLRYEIDEEFQELYLTVLSDVFKDNDEDRTKERKQIVEQIEALDSRITSLNYKFVDELIDHKTYKETKEWYESSKSELVSKHMALQPEGTAMKKYLTFSLCLSKNLSNSTQMLILKANRRLLVRYSRTIWFLKE